MPRNKKSGTSGQLFGTSGHVLEFSRQPGQPGQIFGATGAYFRGTGAYFRGNRGKPKKFTRSSPLTKFQNMGQMSHLCGFYRNLPGFEIGFAICSCFGIIWAWIGLIFCTAGDGALVLDPAGPIDIMPGGPVRQL